MKYFDWDDDKNKWLMRERNISFDLCATIITEGIILDVLQNKAPRQHQIKYIIEIDNYAYVVVSVEDDEKIFFKTVYPSHEATKKYLKNDHEKK